MMKHFLKLFVPVYAHGESQPKGPSSSSSLLLLENIILSNLLKYNIVNCEHGEHAAKLRLAAKFRYATNRSCNNKKFQPDSAV